MSCASSSIKASSFALVLLSLLVFFNWMYLSLGYEEEDGFYAYNEYNVGEGLWGAAPLLLTGIIGLTTACGDTKCKRILLLITSILTIPCIIGLIVSASLTFEWSSEREWYTYYYSYGSCLYNYQLSDYELEDCLSTWKICSDNSYSSYWCNDNFKHCIYYSNNAYTHDCGGPQLYSATQLFIAALALITDIVLIVATSKHHKCCGETYCVCCESNSAPTSVPVVVPATGTTSPGVVYVVPQGYVPTHNNYAGHMQPGQGYPQQVIAPPAYNQGVGGAALNMPNNNLMK